MGAAVVIERQKVVELHAHVRVHAGDLVEAANRVGLSVDSFIAYAVATTMADVSYFAGDVQIEVNGMHAGASSLGLR